jgi:DNA-binding response OmpR family regulator
VSANRSLLPQQPALAQLSEQRDESSREQLFESSEQLAKRRAARQQRVPRVLLAEDDDDFRSLLALRLSAEGYTVVEAEDGDELLDLLVDASTMDADRKLAYDAIITDVLMPGFSGLDVLQAFRRSTASAAVIVMSAFDDTRFVHNARALGAVAFLRKPFDNATLVRILGEALKPVG